MWRRTACTPAQPYSHVLYTLQCAMLSQCWLWRTSAGHGQTLPTPCMQAALLLHDIATFRRLRRASCLVHGAVAEAATLTPLLALFY